MRGENVFADASGAVLFNSSHASPRQYKVLPGMMHPPFCLFSKTNYSIHPSGVCANGELDSFGRIVIN